MTAAAVKVALVLAQSPGRSENPSDAGGVLIVVGIALGVLLVAAVALTLLLRARRGRGAAAPATDASDRSELPSEQGRPFSSER